MYYIPFLLLCFSPFIHASNVTHVAPTVALANDTRPYIVRIDGYSLVNVSSITIGSATCDPLYSNYSLNIDACLQKVTRDAVCAMVRLTFDPLAQPFACAVNKYPCLNYTNTYANCSVVSDVNQPCSYISCIRNTGTCIMYRYSDIPAYASSPAGFEGATCGNNMACYSGSRLCVPNNPPALCPNHIACQMSQRLESPVNDIIIAFTDGSNVTVPSGFSVITPPIVQYVASSSHSLPVSATYSTPFIVSHGTPFEVAVYVPAGPDVNITLLCDDGMGAYVLASSPFVLPYRDESPLRVTCLFQLYYAEYNYTNTLHPSTNLTLTYTRVPVLISSCPNSLLSDIPTRVIVQGDYFYNSSLLMCIFHGVNSPAVFITPQTVACTLAYYNQTTPLDVPLYITNDWASDSATAVAVRVSGACATIKPNSVPSGATCICQPGYQDMGGFCQLCSDGTYQSNFAQQACIPCDASEDTFGVLGATSHDACVCREGKYRRNADDLFCEDCPYGLSCHPNGTSVNAGFWRAEADSTVLVPCLRGSSECPGGTGYGDELCQKGYTGPLCAVCTDGYGRLGGECLPCPAEGLNGFILFVMICVTLVFVYILIKSTTREEKLGDTMGAVIKVMMSYLQLLFYVGKTSANWSGDSNRFFASLVPVTLSPSFLSIQCATSFGFYKNITVMMVLPAIIAIAVFVVVMGKYYIYKHFTRHRVYYLDAINDNAKIRFVLLYLAHPTISQDVIRSFRCTSVAGTGTSFMTDDMSIDCASTSYRLYLVIASLYLVFYLCGFLLYTLYDIRANELHVKNANEGVQHLSGRVYIFFVRGYKNDYLLWEYMIIFRKMGVVIVNSLFPAEVQLVWAFVIISISFCYTVMIYPYRSVVVNHLDTLSLAALDITVVLGFHSLLMKHPNQSAVFAVLVLVNSSMTLLLIAALVNTMKVRISNMFLKVKKVVSLAWVTEKQREFFDNSTAAPTEVPIVMMTNRQLEAKRAKEAQMQQNPVALEGADPNHFDEIEL